MRAAIDVLAALPAPRVLVMGDMGEVGGGGPAFHAEVGGYARERGVERLLAIGELARHAVAAFGPGATLAGDAEAAASLAAPLARAGASILVKGSRFMRMERVVRALAGEAADPHGGAH
jgi:UDP-N-acetylmuramoyl-tripeptide--D-alanyl-D-alanine ligase